MTRNHDKKDDRIYLRINKNLKREVQEYCDARSIDMSDLVTRFFTRVVANENARKRAK
jgi:antitoxin component of RelBE/YafQ-DinJ toxin-antitoxin module